MYTRSGPRKSALANSPCPAALLSRAGMEAMLADMSAAAIAGPQELLGVVRRHERALKEQGSAALAGLTPAPAFTVSNVCILCVLPPPAPRAGLPGSCTTTLRALLTLAPRCSSHLACAGAPPSRAPPSRAAHLSGTT
jgi:hypothetical protein